MNHATLSDVQRKILATLDRCPNASLVVGLGGVRGVGKSTALRQLQCRSSAVHALFCSAALHAYSVEHTGLGLLDHAIPQRDQLREAFGIELAECARRQRICTMIDFHYTDFREDPYKIIQPEALLGAIDVFLLLDAPDEVVMSRRLGESTKGRLLSIDAIQLERASQLRAVQHVADRLGKPFTVVQASGGVIEIGDMIVDGVGVLLTGNNDKKEQY